MPRGLEAREETLNRRKMPQHQDRLLHIFWESAAEERERGRLGKPRLAGL